MRYGRLQPPIEPSAVETPQYGINEFIDINDGLLKGKYPDGSISIIGGGGKPVELLEVPLTLTNSGANYYAKMTSIDPLIGDASNFQITPQAGTNPDLLSSPADLVIRVDLIYYFQCISQPANRRLFGSLFGGARSTGGAISPAAAQNNFRFVLPMVLGAVAPGDDIYSTLSWNGNGPLTLNDAKMLVQFQKLVV